MATLNIGGKSVQVDDSFLKLSPDQQSATVDEIAKSIGVGAANQPAQQVRSQEPKAGSSIDYVPGADLPSLSSTNPPIGGINAKEADDYVRSIANGMTFGLADRFAAGMDAATGRGEDYATNLANERSKTAQFASEHPYANAGMNIAGAAAVPIGAIGAASRGASLGTKVLYGMGGGAAVGGMQGAAQSPDFTDLPQVAKNTAIGVGIGAAIGGAIPVAGYALGQGYRKVADLLTGNADGLSRSTTQHLAAALDADSLPAVRSEINRLGPDAMLADAGPSLLGKAQGASLNSDEGRSILQSALRSRNQGTNARIMADVNSALGPAEDPQTVTNAIRATRSAADNINYPQALNNAPPVDTTALLAQLGPALGNSVGMENRALGNLRGLLLRDVNGVPVPVTDATLLHKIKGELDNVIQYDQPGLGVPAGALSRQQGALKQFRGALNDALEQQVPGYAQANAASSDLARRGEAVEAGTQMLSSGKTTPSPERFAAEFGQMQPGEQIAFAKGNRGEVDRLLGTKINDLQALKGALQGEGGWNTAKLATMYGQDTADQLTGTVDRNLKFRDTYNKVVENSQTAQRQAAANAMKPEPAGEVPLLSPRTTTIGLLLGGGKKAANWLADALRKDPTSSYGEMASVLAAQGPSRDAYLQALADAIQRRQQNAAISPTVGDRAALGAAILANGEIQRRRARTQ